MTDVGNGPDLVVRPVLKWAGGKRQLLPALRPYYPGAFGPPSAGPNGKLRHSRLTPFSRRKYLTEVAMAGKRSIGRSLTICAVVLGLAAAAAPAWAQTGGLRGKVVDAQNKPVDGATVTLVQSDTNSKFTVKSKKGEFMQIGLPPGSYTVTAEKDGLKQATTVRVGLDMAEVTITLRPGGSGAPMTKEEAEKAAAKMEGLKAAFSEGAALSNSGKYDEAVAKFNEVLAGVPKCTECYINIGATYALKKDYAQSEAAYKKALELDPNSVESYYGLAAIYNDQKKFTEAQAMSAEASKRSGAAAGGAGGAPNADTLYNQGVIAWNANDFPKAQEHFAAAVAANPNHAEAHFMLGRTNLNLGKLPEAAKEFEAYVKIAPNGPNAKEAQSNFEMLKQYVK
jgi:Flp pilus assembly protein TadD